MPDTSLDTLTPTAVVPQQRGVPGAEDSLPPDDDPSGDFVTFHLAGELFAFPMSRVREIIRMPALVRVPLSPASLDGLANLRGAILPVVDLRSCCGLERQPHEDSTRVIVLNSAAPLGVVVDRVAAVLSVEPDEVQDVAGITSTLDSELLEAVLRRRGDDQMIAVLDVLGLVDEQFPAMTRQALAAGSVAVAVEQDTESEGLADVVELVSFVVDGQEYALPIQQVQEIVQSPEAVSHIPNSDPRVLGVMDLRGALLPVVSLRRIFNLPQAALDRSNRVVVVHLEDAGSERVTVGVVMDTVREVLRVPRDVVDDLPAFLAESGQAAEVDAVCRLDHGKRVVSVLSAQRLFSQRGLQAALQDTPALQARTQAGQDDSEEGADVQTEVDELAAEEQLVVFRVGQEEYCVNVDAVQEIIRVPEQLIRVPSSLHFVEGLVNLRGSVLPVVNLRKRMDLEGVERDDRQRIVVLDVSGVRTGFIVDAVVEVLKLERRLVEPSPDIVAGGSALICEVANLTASERMLLILRPDRLLAGEELQALREDAEGAA